MGRPKDESVWKNYKINHDKTVQCNHCDKKYKMGNVNRMAQHLINCFKCPLTVQNEIKQKRIPLQPVSSNNTEQETTSSQQGDENAFEIRPSTSFSDHSTTSKTQLTEKLAKAIIVSGTPFSMVEHPLWKDFFKELSPSFNLPSRKSLSDTYLERAYKEVKADVKKELKKENYMHLQCDGWSNVNNEGVINFIISNPNPFFVESIATEEHRHTSEYISEEIVKIMKAYGEQQICTLIGDNARNIQKAFELVKLQYPHVELLNCAAHTLNLLCHDAIKHGVIKATIEMVTDVIKTFKKSQILLSILNKLIKEKSGETLKLPCKTRWGSHLNALRSMKNSKTILQGLAIDENLPIQIPSDIKNHLLDDSFWNLIDQCFNILEPICAPIFELESNECNIQNVYMTFKDIKSKLAFVFPTISIIDESTKTQILGSASKRMKDCIKPLHLAAYLLNPLNQGVELSQDEDLEAMSLISKMAQAMHLNVMHDLAQYKAKEGIWSKEFIWNSVQDLNALIWWKGLCKSSPLSKIATRILSAPCTSAATERSFSMHANIHNTKRNRLLKEKAAKITYIAYNWNLFHKLHPTSTADPEDDMEEILEESTDINLDDSDGDDINMSIQFIDCGEVINFNDNE